MAAGKFKYKQGMHGAQENINKIILMEGGGIMPDLKISLTDDPLKNICLMAPYLDESGQNRVFGMICGLLGFSGEEKRDGQKGDE